MKSTRSDSESGVILVIVLVLLTLFGTVGVTFVYYADNAQCEHNPTAERGDVGCTRVIGNDRR